MKEIWTFIQAAFTALGGAIGWFIGGADGLVYALLIFVIVDYITGVMCAIQDKRLSSAVGFIGICKRYSFFFSSGSVMSSTPIS